MLDCPHPSMEALSTSLSIFLYQLSNLFNALFTKWQDDQVEVYLNKLDTGDEKINGSTNTKIISWILNKPYSEEHMWPCTSFAFPTESHIPLLVKSPHLGLKYIRDLESINNSKDSQPSKCWNWSWSLIWRLWPQEETASQQISHQSLSEPWIIQHSFF